jgi:hypothetical protein
MTTLRWPPLPVRPVRRGRFNLRFLEEGAVLEGSAQPPTGGGADPPTVPLPFLYSTVSAYAAANPGQFAAHCVHQPGGTWDFLDGVVAALRAIDTRFGFCWRPERNDFGIDVVAYYHGVAPPVHDSPNVYVVDIIVNSCNFGSTPGWADVTSPSVIRRWRLTR